MNVAIKTVSSSYLHVELELMTRIRSLASREICRETTKKDGGAVHMGN